MLPFGIQSTQIHLNYWNDKDYEKFDKITFSSIDKNNPRRVLRAWEVLKATGKPISYFHQNRMPSLISAKESFKCVLKLKKTTLDHLNAERFREMLSAGAIEECELARRNGMSPLSQSFKAIGVSEIVNFFQDRRLAPYSSPNGTSTSGRKLTFTLTLTSASVRKRPQTL